MLLKSKYVELTEQELKDTEGGFAITGTMIGIGVGIFASSFAVGYAIGQSNRR